MLLSSSNYTLLKNVNELYEDFSMYELKGIVIIHLVVVGK